MNLSKRLRVVAGSLVCSVVMAVLPQATAHAAPVAWGTVLVPGWQWAGSASTLGDINVYSNGTGNQDRPIKFGLGFECIELAQRYAFARWGEQPYWPVSYATQMWDVAPYLKVPLRQLGNGGGTLPQAGDLLVFAPNAQYGPAGHVAIVASYKPGWVTIVEQNWNNGNPTGWASLPIQGTTMPARYGFAIKGWLRPGGAPVAVQATNARGYTADGFGNVYPYGTAGPVGAPAHWPVNLTRGIVSQPNKDAGYILDAWGGVHNFGWSYPVTTGAYWPGWDVARGIALRADGRSGYTLDAYGGVHPFGGAPTVGGFAYWPGFDIARGIVLRPDGVSGYTLDGWGGVHPFGGAPAVRMTAYWGGFDIARGITINADGRSGYVVDGWDGVHAFGLAPEAAQPPYFPGRDVARGIHLNPAGGGYVVLTDGSLRNFGGAGFVQGAILRAGNARGVS